MEAVPCFFYRGENLLKPVNGSPRPTASISAKFHCTRLLYYFDRRFAILENFHAEMTDIFSFDLRRI